MSIAAECRQISYDIIKASKDKHITYRHILMLLDELGPMTAEEIAKAMYARRWLRGNQRGNVHPRVTELKKEGAIMEWGVKKGSCNVLVTIFASVSGWQQILIDLKKRASSRDD